MGRVNGEEQICAGPIVAAVFSSSRRLVAAAPSLLFFSFSVSSLECPLTFYANGVGVCAFGLSAELVRCSCVVSSAFPLSYLLFHRKYVQKARHNRWKPVCFRDIRYSGSRGIQRHA
jgi:hypothetical protein